jgi:hypothetical protein
MSLFRRKKKNQPVTLVGDQKRLDAVIAQMTASFTAQYGQLTEPELKSLRLVAAVQAPRALRRRLSCTPRRPLGRRLARSRTSRGARSHRARRRSTRRPAALLAGRDGQLEGQRRLGNGRRLSSGSRRRSRIQVASTRPSGCVGRVSALRRS